MRTNNRQASAVPVCNRQQFAGNQPVPGARNPLQGAACPVICIYPFFHPTQTTIMFSETLNNSTKSGTFGGTLLVLFLQVNWNDLLETAIIAAIGSTTSFWIAILWRWLSKKFLR
jgi:hypothetical protein